MDLERYDMKENLQCTICRREPTIYRRPFEGVKLCKRCFKRSIERKVQRTISKYSMFTPKSYIGVAVSGGKDSLALLHILNRIEKNFPESTITALTVDEGIKNYRNESLSLIKKVTSKLDISINTISFKELFGATLDDLVKLKTTQFPCSYCGVLRRRALEELAKKTGVDCLATAHNLDDEAQTVILNIIHGNPLQLFLSKPILDGETVFVKKVKPFVLIPEKEIALYAYLTKIPFQRLPCPYAGTALRNDMRQLVNYLEEKHPGTLYTVYRSGEKLRKTCVLKINKEFTRCYSCGYPSSSTLCSVCKIIKCR